MKEMYTSSQIRTVNCRPRHTTLVHTPLYDNLLLVFPHQFVLLTMKVGAFKLEYQYMNNRNFLVFLFFMVLL